jgi:hypothetical protein
MVRAVVRGGQVALLGPLPPDWSEGQELEVQAAAPELTPDEVDQRFRAMAAACPARRAAVN